MVRVGVSGHKILCCTCLGHSQRISKLHHWFKSRGNFDEWVDFVYWWSCNGKGLRSTGLPHIGPEWIFLAILMNQQYGQQDCWQYCQPYYCSAILPAILYEALPSRRRLDTIVEGQSGGGARHPRSDHGAYPKPGRMVSEV